MSSHTVLVIGATGVQGGAVARALLRNNWTVHALVRNATSPAAQALRSQGVSIFKGDWDDTVALQKAATGCTGLFLNSYPDFQDVEAEIRHARNILTAAKDAGIKNVIHSSAIGVDRHEHLLSLKPGSLFANYYGSKRTIEELVQNGGWESWTILRGVNFMTNFLLPLAAYMFPELVAEGKFLTAYGPGTKLLLVDPEDFGAFAYAALSEPQKYGGKGIDIASDLLTLQEMATLMEKVSGKKIEVSFRSEEEIESQLDLNPIIASQVMVRDMQTWMDIEAVKLWGIPLTTFEQFLVKQRESLNNSIGGWA